MLRLYRIVLFLLSTTILPFVFVHGQCPNADFSQGNFSGWTPLTGTYNQGSGLGLNVVGAPAANRHTIISTPGTDPQTGNNLQVIPPGYTSSARISGSNVSGGASSGLSYTMNVTAQNALFIYNYAVVLQDPGHSSNQQPRFELSVRDAGGNLVPCTFYDIRAAGNMPGWNSNGSIRWKNWTKVGIDLSSQIGSSVTITAGVAGCVRQQGAHWGYAYLVAECRPMEIDIKYCLGDTVALLIAPPGFESYTWNPGGATTQTISISNPDSIAVNYTLDLVSNSGQCHSRLTALLSSSFATADFSSTTQCGNSVNFSDLSVPTNDTISAWYWDFGDGNTIGPGNSPLLSYQNPTHTYTTPGTYTVTMSPTTGNGCTDTVQHVIQVYPSPNAAFTFQGSAQSPTHPDAFCSPVVDFVGTASHNPPYNATIPIVNVEWDFGDGGTSNQYNTQHTYSSDGTHSVSFIATDSRGCRDTVVQELTIYTPPVADFDYTRVCFGDSTVFTNTSIPQSATIATSFWNFGDLNTANTYNSSNTYQSPGTHNVTLAVISPFGCGDTITKPIDVYYPPTASFIPPPVCMDSPTQIRNTSSIAQGSIASYSWNFGTPSIPGSTDIDPTITYNSYGTFPITLTVVSDNGCVDTSVQSIEVWPKPIVDFTAQPTQGCYPFPVNFVNTSSIAQGSIISYSWSLGNGYSSTSPSLSHTYGNSFSHYTVSLTATSDRGCVTTTTKPDFITVWPKPEADFFYTPQYPNTVDNSIVHLQNHSEGGDTYVWFLPWGGVANVYEPSSMSFADTGTYWVTHVAITEYGCTDTITKPIVVKEGITVYIPNSFTPNGNDINDNFRIVGNGIQECALRIYNRWGEEIARIIGPDAMYIGWDGTSRGKPVKQDTYVYLVNIIDVLGKEHTFRGRVTVIR